LINIGIGYGWKKSSNLAVAADLVEIFSFQHSLTSTMMDGYGLDGWMDDG
jgi:hypothetical protein